QAWNGCVTMRKKEVNFMSKTLKVAIIGCGGIENGKHLPSLAQQPEVEMVTFCDIIEKRAATAAAQYGGENAKVYNDYRQLLRETDAEVAHVCSPDDSHAQITGAWLESGRHVMCETPMAETAGQARPKLDAAKGTGKKLTIAY